MTDDTESDAADRANSNAATSLALGLAAQDPRIADDARAYLRKQVELANYQIADLRREDRLRHWSLRVRHVSDVMKLAFEISLALIVVAVTVGLAASVWGAAHDDSVVVEAFSVPPDMTARGLTGQAVAAQLQDKLAAMQRDTDSARPAASYSNNWGGDIKVEIPNTGVSIGEFYRYLASWLGHRTHITGEVYRTAGAGVAVTARVGQDSTSNTGTDSDLDKMMQKTAEAIYRKTQPYRYASYIEFHSGRTAEAREIFVELTADSSSKRERVWAYNGLGALDEFTTSLSEAVEYETDATNLDPGFALGYENIDGLDSALGHDEVGLANAAMAVRLLQDRNAVDMNERARAISYWIELSNLDFYRSDFVASLRDARIAVSLPDYSGIVEASLENIPVNLALLHEKENAEKAFASLPATKDPITGAARAVPEVWLSYALGDWSRILSAADRVPALYDRAYAVTGTLATLFPLADIRPRQIWPNEAYAMTMLGNASGAETLIAKTPLDCLVCLRMRGRIEAQRGNWKGADNWFARATTFAPSIGLTWYDWGEALRAKGDLNAATAKYKVAHAKSPNFADPLERLGEVMIAKNRSDLALPLFSEAAKYAPNWGRLHLKWGEALLWSGDKAAASKQFATASELDLRPDERVQLSKWAAS